MLTSLRKLWDVFTGAQVVRIRKSQWVRERRWPRAAHAALRIALVAYAMLLVFDRPVAIPVAYAVMGAMAMHLVDYEIHRRRLAQLRTQSEAAHEGEPVRNVY
jgi:hypothetical protein